MILKWITCGSWFLVLGRAKRQSRAKGSWFLDESSGKAERMVKGLQKTKREFP